MANSSARKGTRRERELVNAADGYPEVEVRMTGLRCPASGGATTRDLPDCLVMRYDRAASRQLGYRVSRMWAVEVKAQADGCGRLAHEEVFALCRYALACGATPLIAVKPNYQPWSFFEPREMTVADESRGVTRAMLPGRSFEEVFLDA